MGYLLLNGTLGTCVNGTKTLTGIECVIHINLNRSRFGNEVVDFLAEDRDANLKDVENFPLVVFFRNGDRDAMTLTRRDII